VFLADPLGLLSKMFTVKPAEGIQASSFPAGQKIYVGPAQLLPMQMFLEEPKPTYVSSISI
jgi:H/ACA ribonucleoprotein complex subunit 1